MTPTPTVGERSSSVLRKCAFCVILAFLLIRCIYACAFVFTPTVEIYAEPYLWQIIVVVFAAMTTLRLLHLARKQSWSLRRVPIDEKVAAWSQLWFATLILLYSEGIDFTGTVALLAVFPMIGVQIGAPHSLNVFITFTSIGVVLLLDVSRSYFLYISYFQDNGVAIVHRTVGFAVAVGAGWCAALSYEHSLAKETRRGELVIAQVQEMLTDISEFDPEHLAHVIDEGEKSGSLPKEPVIAGRNCLRTLLRLRPYLPPTMFQVDSRFEEDVDEFDDEDPQAERLRELNYDRGISFDVDEGTGGSVSTVLRKRLCTVITIQSLEVLRPGKESDIVMRAHSFLGIVLQEIAKNDGVVASMTPSTVVATFNAQAPCVRHTKRACVAALGILGRTAEGCLDFAADVFMAIDTRDHLAGVCGVDRQLSRVVAGRGIDLTRDLVSLGRYLHTPILVTQPVVDELGEKSTLKTVPVDIIRPLWDEGSGTAPEELRIHQLCTKVSSDMDTKAYVDAFTALRDGRLSEAASLLALYKQVGDPSFVHALRLENICAHHSHSIMTRYLRRQQPRWEHFRGEEDLLFSVTTKINREVDTALVEAEPDEENFKETLAELQPPPPAQTEEATDGLIDMFCAVDDDEPSPDDDDVGEGDSDRLPRTFYDDVFLHSWLLSGRSLGTGSFSAVYLGMSSVGQLVAMKVFSLRARQTNPRLLAEEVTRMRKLQHHNVVSYYTCALLKLSGHFIIVMEYVSGGSLKYILDTFGPPPVTAIRKYVTDLLHGLSYLHQNGIIHCDVKPHNALLTSDGSCKLSDFGSAVNATLYNVTPDDEVMVRGTSYYLAPEACRNDITSAVDIWSVGITVLELYTGRLPWEFKGGEAAFIRELGKNQSFMPVIPGDIPASLAAFCKRCLTRVPEERPTAEELLRSPFLTG